LRENCLSSV